LAIDLCGQKGQRKARYSDRYSGEVLR